MSILRDAAQSLADLREQAASTAVTYVRTDGTTLSLQAAIGSTIYSTSDSYGVVRNAESRDYIIRRNALVVGGAVVDPQIGDRIIEPDGSVYEVHSPAGEPAFRYSDVHRVSIRVHARAYGGAHG